MRTDFKGYNKGGFVGYIFDFLFVATICDLGERTGLVVRASDSRSGDPGSIPRRGGVLFP